mmetsp:Transcript_151/g.577  ORF Transcript_151/g.577 Transcript_151/m.577 type:complete len:208 (-) Transcript_151:18-641(-)
MAHRFHRAKLLALSALPETEEASKFAASHPARGLQHGHIVHPVVHNFDVQGAAAVPLRHIQEELLVVPQAVRRLQRRLEKVPAVDDVGDEGRPRDARHDAGRDAEQRRVRGQRIEGVLQGEPCVQRRWQPLRVRNFELHPGHAFLGHRPRVRAEGPQLCARTREPLDGDDAVHAAQGPPGVCAGTARSLEHGKHVYEFVNAACGAVQ